MEKTKLLTYSSIGIGIYYFDWGVNFLFFYVLFILKVLKS